MPYDFPLEARWKAEVGQVVQVNHVTEKYWLIKIEASHAARWTGPGQFVMLRAEKWDGLLLPRPFDVYRTHPDQDTFEVLIKTKGQGTADLAGLRTGDLINVVAPAGARLNLQDCQAGVGFIARGAGVTPMVRIAQECKEIGLSCYGLVSAREEQLLLGVDTLRELSAKIITTTDESGDSTDKPREMVNDWLQKEQIGILFTCGSRRMGRLVQEVSSNSKVCGYIFQEYRMACGTGICVGCAAPLLGTDGNFRYGLVCMEGPAFPAESVILDWGNHP